MRLLGSFHNTTKRKRRIEVCVTSCIVTNFLDKCQLKILINPANQDLSGVSNFSYFPKGGPVPHSRDEGWQSSAKWSGMDAGSNMLYPSQVVDGIVHQLGGKPLLKEIQWKQRLNLFGNVCPIGTCIMTSDGNKELVDRYFKVVHTAPPFYDSHNENESIRLLEECYKSSFEMAFDSIHWKDHDDTRVVACPLIGAGARGFPINIAIEAASCQCLKWLHNNDCEQHNKCSQDELLVFGIMEEYIAKDLVDALESERK